MAQLKTSQRNLTTKCVIRAQVNSNKRERAKLFWNFKLGNEKKILALTPREVSASTLMDRWKPMLTHRKENSKQNKLFPDIKKDL